jgi:hypothetical protein
MLLVKLQGWKMQGYFSRQARLVIIAGRGLLASSDAFASRKKNRFHAY